MCKSVFPDEIKTSVYKRCSLCVLAQEPLPLGSLNLQFDSSEVEKKFFKK